MLQVEDNSRETKLFVDKFGIPLKTLCPQRVLLPQEKILFFKTLSNVSESAHPCLSNVEIEQPWSVGVVRLRLIKFVSFLLINSWVHLESQKVIQRYENLLKGEIRGRFRAIPVEVNVLFDHLDRSSERV